MNVSTAAHHENAWLISEFTKGVMTAITIIPRRGGDNRQYGDLLLNLSMEFMLSVAPHLNVIFKIQKMSWRETFYTWNYHNSCWRVRQGHEEGWPGKIWFVLLTREIYKWWDVWKKSSQNSLSSSIFSCVVTHFRLMIRPLIFLVLVGEKTIHLCGKDVFWETVEDICQRILLQMTSSFSPISFCILNP